MVTLSNNQDLYNYLVDLAKQLEDRRFEDLSEAVLFASRRISDLSTEFLGESRIALRKVLKEGNHVLLGGEQVDLLNVLEQLDVALDKRR